MKERKGFTLVELLAVIAILAILVIMALPAVLRMYRQSRINTFQNETRSVYRTAQSQFLGDSMLLGSGQKILYTNGCNSSSEADVVKSLDMTGNSNFKYYVLIDVDGKVLEVRSSNGTYSYSKTGSDLKAEDMDVETYNDSELDSDISSTICDSSSGGSGSGSSTPSATNVATCVTEGCTKTAVGTELTVGGENFYVVSSDATNTVLLAKYDLKSDGSGSYIQDTSGTNTNILIKKITDVGFWDACQYSTTTYSCIENSTPGLISPYNDNNEVYCENKNSTNCVYIYDENVNLDLFDAINKYAQKISTASGTTMLGKLMSLEQANSLSTDIRKDMNGYNYWLGTASGYGSVWVTTSAGKLICDFESNNLYSSNGIRPVIIVSTSSL